jgi:hypothetical protein
MQGPHYRKLALADDVAFHHQSSHIFEDALAWPAVKRVMYELQPRAVALGLPDRHVLRPHLDWYNNVSKSTTPHETSL